jgi:hypothetical protein
VSSTLPAAVGIGWFASWSVFAGTALVAPALLLLPDGRLPSPRWQAAIWFGVFSVVLAAATYAFMPGQLRALPVADNPLALADAGPLLLQLRLAAMVPLPLSIVISATGLVLRFRVAQGEQRQQLKWIAYGAVIWAIAYAATATRLWAP